MQQKGREAVNEGETRRVLLVEDEALVALSEQQTIERHGYKVLVAHSGEQALQIARDEAELALVLMDIDLGQGMDGTEAAHLILQERDVPVVFLTAHGEEQYVDRVKRITGYGYVLKHSGEFVLIESMHMALKLFEAHRQTRRAEQELRHIVDEAPVGIYHSWSHGAFEQMNPRMAEILGFTSPKEAVEHYTDIAEQVYAEPKRRAKFVELLQQRGTVRGFRLEGRRATGETAYLNTSARVHRTDAERGLLINGFIIDETEQEREKREAQRNRKRLEATMRAGNLAWWEMELPSGTVRFSDEKAAMLGYPPEGFTTYHDFTALLHPDDREPTMQAMRDHLSGNAEQYAVDYRIKPKNGDYRWFSDLGRVTARDADGKPTMVTGVVVDVSQRKAHELQLEELLRERQLYLRETHHRVKNDMAMVEGLLWLQAQASSEEETRSALDEARRRVSVIRDAYRKLYETQMLDSVEVGSFLQSLVDEVAYSYGAYRGVKVRCHAATMRIPARMTFALGMMVNELLTNAYKHAFDDDHGAVITVTVHPEKDASDAIRLSVSDNGVGIPEGSDSGQSYSSGLTLVRELATQYRGSFRLYNDGGTVAELVLQLPQSDAHA